ncbi:MAG TPA: hypothetical protein ENJ18_01470 [Nannocystis exedens]|nr:hypothetical protein [Nannocystis exedens]
MKHRVRIDRLELRIRGQVDDPRALAEAISRTIAARIAADLSTGSSREIVSIDAGRFTLRGAAMGAAEAVATILADPQATREVEG